MSYEPSGPKKLSPVKPAYSSGQRSSFNRVPVSTSCTRVGSAPHTTRSPSFPVPQRVRSMPQYWPAVLPVSIVLLQKWRESGRTFEWIKSIEPTTGRC